MVEGCQILVSNTYLSIVDDESDITLAFHEALKSLPGITIFTFTEPELALEHFKTNKNFYALVISDLRMPVINGFQLLKTVKDLNPEVRTVLITAFEVEDKLFQEYRKKKSSTDLLKNQSVWTIYYKKLEHNYIVTNC